MSHAQNSTPVTSGADAAQQFFKELQEHTETLHGIADQHGLRTLADVMRLQNAILDGRFVELSSEASEVLTIVDALPSAATWRQYILLDGQAGGGAVSAIRLRNDTPNHLLEMLLFTGEPQGRSRQELEDRFASSAHIPYLAKCFGEARA